MLEIPILLLLCAPTAPPLEQEEAAPVVGLHALERQAGWELLFDGKSTEGWRGLGLDRFPERGWRVEEGCLHRVPGPSGGDIVAERSFQDFELVLQWKLAERGNSGIKYRAGIDPEGRSMLGPEYQLQDDAAHGRSATSAGSTGALYAVYPPQVGAARPAGEFNRARIAVRGEWIEHWLNGVRLVSCRWGSEDWLKRVARSKFAEVEGFGGPRPGLLGLQDHGSEVWFRDIRVRDLGALPGEAIALYDGESLAGWKAIGDARYLPEADGILGETGGGGHSFLVSERSYGDFMLDVDVRPEARGNSGIQVRSHIRDTGRLFGYQIEIDSSERAWSGGLYDEGRRGWLDNLADNEAGRAAFRFGEWNHYRIECLGPWIRVWVNGIPTADYLDHLDMEGAFALQVHSGQDTRVHWGGLKLRDLGTRSWLPLFDGSTTGGFSSGRADAWSVEEGALVGRTGAGGAPLVSERELDDFSLRLVFREEGARLGLAFRSLGEGATDADGFIEPAPGLQRTPACWRFDLAACSERLKEGEWNELAIMAYGSRIAVNLNGRQEADLRGAAGPRRGKLVLEARGGAEGRVRIREIELLGEPR